MAVERDTAAAPQTHPGRNQTLSQRWEEVKRKPVVYENGQLWATQSS